MRAINSKIRRSAFRALIVPVTAAALVAALAAPTWAGTTVTFDPTGGGGLNPAVTVNAAQFSWSPGNAAAFGAISPGSGPALGQTFTLRYQAILGGINGLTKLGGGVSITSQANDGQADGGTITTGGIGTGREVTITAIFREQITKIDTSVPGQTTLTISFVPGAPNLVSIYDAVAGTAKNFAGTGFDAGTLVLQGSVIPSGLEGDYKSTFVTQTNATTQFNQYSAITDPLAAAFWAGTQTTSGTGSTFLPVQLDPTKTNPLFFPTGGPSFVQINFTSISTADPFNSVEPSKIFFGGFTPSLGAINGFSSTDIQFQTVATNDFSVPEPSSIITALTAATFLPMFFCFRRFRSRKNVA